MKKTRQINLRVSEEDYLRWRQAVEVMNWTLTNLIAVAVNEFLDEDGRPGTEGKDR